MRVRENAFVTCVFYTHTFTTTTTTTFTNRIEPVKNN